MTGARRLVGVAVAVGLALGLAAPAVAQGQLTPDEAARRLAERFGVEVLDVVEARQQGSLVYIVTVMNPGGNYNGAFRVTRLMVDAATGELVPQVGQGAAGYQIPGEGDRPQESGTGG